MSFEPSGFDWTGKSFTSAEREHSTALTQALPDGEDRWIHLSADLGRIGGVSEPL
jgi:hypothetical protein